MNRARCSSSRFCALVLFLFANKLYALAGFVVAPGSLEIDLSKPATGAILVTNPTDKDMLILVEPTFYRIDHQTIRLGEYLSPGVPEIENISELIRVSPRRIRLPPGARRDVRVSIVRQLELREGDYRADILFKAQDPVGRTYTESNSAKELDMVLAWRFQIRSSIRGFLGERKPQLLVTCLRSESNHIKMLIVNPSIWTFRGKIRVYGVAQGAGPILEKTYLVNRESKRFLQTEVQAANDQYLIQFIDRDDQVMESTPCRVQ